MPLFEMKSQSQTCSLQNAATDFRTARRVGQYRAGGEAVYFPAFPGQRYLPYGALSKAWTKNTAITVTGCCGKQLPMVRLRMFYDGEFYQDFLFEKQTEADVILDAIRAARPELPLERDTTPRE
ncbi:hypothetical protein [Oscillibacter sp.]|uniref:hypothetical protein n=1 Tax=Oscillibacter sp. TaxID=1945593 RepID=UPI0026048C10|nr:hypothetical protein [Oscillibacter sp.]MDD3346794.1 hypothetical protein [Oscillibacter sp.]